MGSPGMALVVCRGRDLVFQSRTALDLHRHRKEQETIFLKQ